LHNKSEQPQTQNAFATRDESKYSPGNGVVEFRFFFRGKSIEMVNIWKSSRAVHAVVNPAGKIFVW
jgi:hypothetical protein